MSFLGSFGGLDGGDIICQELADAADLSGTYLAWLSDSSSSPSTRFLQGDLPFQLVDGSVVADDWADLADGALSSAVHMTEEGLSLGGSFGVWTGTGPAGGALAEHCSEWTSPVATGVVGDRIHRIFRSAATP